MITHLYNVIIAQHRELLSRLDAIYNLLAMEKRIMTQLSDELVAAVTAEKNEASAVMLALEGVAAQNTANAAKIAELQAQIASGSVSPAAIQQAISDLGASTADMTSRLAAAIPASATPATVAAAGAAVVIPSV